MERGDISFLVTRFETPPEHIPYPQEPEVPPGVPLEVPYQPPAEIPEPAPLEIPQQQPPEISRKR